MGLACNADGTEKLPVLFIGKYARPRCFKNASPESLGLHYCSNKNTWMTMVIFEEYEQILPDNGPKLTLYQQ